MIISLPKDVIKIQRAHKPMRVRFAFDEEHGRMAIPGTLVAMFSSETYGIDLWLSKKEKCAYLKFVPKQKAYFNFNARNGYVGCSDLFKWAHNLEIPLFKEYEYTDYVIDKKNKMVKVNLERN